MHGPTNVKFAPVYF